MKICYEGVSQQNVQEFLYVTLLEDRFLTHITDIWDDSLL